MASWLVQADWPETYVLADPFRGVQLTTGDFKPAIAGLSQHTLPDVDAPKLNEMLRRKVPQSLMWLTVLVMLKGTSLERGS